MMQSQGRRCLRLFIFPNRPILLSSLPSYFVTRVFLIILNPLDNGRPPCHVLARMVNGTLCMCRDLVNYPRRPIDAYIRSLPEIYVTLNLGGIRVSLSLAHLPKWVL